MGNPTTNFMGWDGLINPTTLSTAELSHPADKIEKCSACQTSSADRYIPMVVFVHEKTPSHGDDMYSFKIKGSDNSIIASADVMLSAIGTYHLNRCMLHKKLSAGDIRRTVYITWISTTSTERNKYYATKLLYYIFRHFHKLGYKYVTLHDASDRSNKPTCIYRQVGLRYLKKGQPEMIGNLRHILYGSNRGLNGRNTDPDVFYRNCERRTKNLARLVEKDRLAVQAVRGELVDGMV